VKKVLRRVIFGVLLAGAIIAGSCTDLRYGLVSLFSPSYAPAAKRTGDRPQPIFDGNDVSRPKIAIELSEIATELVQPTDIQFVPGDPRLMIVLEKSGRAKWIDLDKRTAGTFFTVKVLDDSEQGLLGLAFHPQFQKNGRFFVNSTPRSGSDDVTRIAEWKVPPGSDLRKTAPKETETLLEIAQPYQNHNAGQLAFGPDGKLYIGMGDGGWANDPHGHGQNPRSLLGDMLRIDVDARDSGKKYAVPADNPFVGKKDYAPEIWAIGLRNPWRYTFDPQGRLIVADVGQDLHEEIDIVERGANLGWNIREAAHCFAPKTGCETKGLIDPIFEYGRDDGGSVTGGFVAKNAPLAGKYVFGDFLSGRLWALDLPPAPVKAYALGRWPILPSTFGIDAEGAIYVADYADGIVYRIDAAKKE
jgi:glucose/arabinose dehydrogenase